MQNSTSSDAMRLKGLRIAVIATDAFEETELTEPQRALHDAGADVDVVSLKRGEIQAVRHHDNTIRVKVDRTIEETHAGDYNAAVLPGGALNADRMRIEPKLQQLLRSFDQEGKPIAAICHAPWELISAGLVRGRTSRQPSDIPAFNREMLNLFAHAPAGAIRL